MKRSLNLDLLEFHVREATQEFYLLQDVIFPQRRREKSEMREDDVRRITGDIIDSAMKIHKMFGPGMLESVYERILAIELKRRGHSVECQKVVGFTYEDEAFENAFRLDLLVDGEVVVELKSTGAMNPVFAKQLRTYLVLSGLEVGLVVNFGMALMKDGIVQVINSHNLNDSPARLCASASLREKENGFPQMCREKSGTTL